MKPADIADLRMRNLRLSGTPMKNAEEVVRWLGAVQSQEFGPAKWSIAERSRGVRDETLDAMYEDGTILRTHVLRPTWHFVLPEDIGWMLDLTGERVRRAMSHYDRRLGIEPAETKRCNRLIAKALTREGRLTRQELRAALNKAGVEAQGQRLNHIVINAEQHGVICSGGLRGKKHTYALLEERAPNAKRLSRDEALAELTRRYFTSHGPATAKDFRWWASLTLTDIKRGLEMVGSGLETETIDGIAYWFPPTGVRRRPNGPRVHLLQPYDEYVVAYTESRYWLDISGEARKRFPVIFSGSIALDGQIAGSYERTLSDDAVLVEATLFRPFNGTEMKQLRDAVGRLGTFLGLKGQLLTARS